ncbi:hypothetical protein BJ508DRAFT_311078 [Ascobolus immersus RN42]|uniref:Uncharacterized protein n=1 Tax=Ascobolus immersus RN42 TaxID=1160509 RepID=A0A3N4HRI7_ASCIM|nr:hypothetical protein BJ508DRAFT_311078 [Ascobolus immersus RN42]
MDQLTDEEIDNLELHEIIELLLDGGNPQLLNQRRLLLFCNLLRDKVFLRLQQRIEERYPVQLPMPPPPVTATSRRMLRSGWIRFRAHLNHIWTQLSDLRAHYFCYAYMLTSENGDYPVSLNRMRRFARTMIRFLGFVERVFLEYREYLLDSEENIQLVLGFNLITDELQVDLDRIEDLLDVMQLLPETGTPDSQED